MERESEFLARGGKFIVPMPEVKIEPSHTTKTASSDALSGRSFTNDAPEFDAQASKKKRALITGVAGQDGTYLAALLRSKGYEVIGMDVPGSVPRTELSRYIACDVSDTIRLAECLRELRPDECYHLAAFHRSSSVRENESVEDQDRMSLETNLLSAQTILRTLSDVRPDCRVFFAGSCHMFGDANDVPQSERTPFSPTNTYGITKAAAAQLGRIYRTKGMYVCTGILYNHESPLRGSHFVTSKIVRAAVDAARGKTDRLVVGNLDARVDWGFAGDYVRAMHLMLQAEKPEDFVIASGTLHRVRDFVEIAFARVGLDWRDYVTEDANAYRPVSRSVFHGDPTAIRDRLGWKPETSFKELVEMMVDDCVAGKDRR
jgi:GDPmannose 4,6-dehydratase